MSIQETRWSKIEVKTKKIILFTKPGIFML